MIEPQTYKEQDREFTLKALKAVRHTILVMNEVYRDFWGRDPQQIVETMNASVDLYLERFHSNTMLGIVLNDRATAAGISDRMRVTMPENYSYDSESRTFSYSVPVVIEPEPEIIVEPQVIEEVVTPEPEIITEEVAVDEPEVIIEEPINELT
jgi:hypothetical protein